MRGKVYVAIAAAALWLLLPAAAQAGVVVGASAGETGIDVSSSEDVQNLDFSESDFSWKAYGGFRFFKFFGLQAEYIDFGSPSQEDSGLTVDLSGTGWNIAAEGVLPLGKHFELFAKAGYVFWNFDTSFSGLVSGDSSDSGEDFNYGAGAAFIIGELVGIRVEWQRFEISNTDAVDFISAGVDFRF